MNFKFNIKARLPCINEIISENIIKYILLRNNLKCKNAKSGDLISDDNIIKYECKCFTTLGPISFGPTESWNKILFLDSRKWFDNIIICYYVDISSNDSEWLNIKVSKTETYQDQCKLKRRPRLSWNKLINQIPKDKISILYSGSVVELCQS